MNSSVESGAAWELFQQFVTEGEARIKRVIDSNESEGTYLEFKRSFDERTKSVTSDLTEPAKQHLAKMISAFGNTLGGVLVWGIAAPKNKPNSGEPIPDVAAFVRALESEVPKCAAPSVIGVKSHPILVGDGTAGYAVTYIPRGYTAHQCVNAGAYNYWMRDAESTKVMPHVLVEALIMARARPELNLFIPSTRVRPRFDGLPYLSITLGVRNSSNVVARDVALTVALSELDLAVGKNSTPEGEVVQIIEGDSVRSAKLFALPSSEVVHPGVIRELCEVQYPLTSTSIARSLRFDVWIHADGYQSERSTRLLTKEDLQQYTRHL